MPLTLIVTEGVLAKDSEKPTVAKLCQAFLRAHGLEGNTVLTPNVIGSLHLLPQDHSFAGMENKSVAFVEWKVPSFAFNTKEIQQSYVAEATDIIHKASGGKLPRNQIWVNVVHTVNGGWGIAGEAFTNEQLIAAVSQG